MKKPWPRALILGIIASVFFSATYILNSSIAQSGGDWLWSACLRYILMCPILFVLTAKQGWKPIFTELRRDPGRWILWSTVGFGAFYAPMAFAAAYGPGWMVAGAFQTTMIFGALETPLFRDKDGRRQKIPTALFPAFAVIILGVFLLQLEQMRQEPHIGKALLFAIPMFISAAAYPLGNRKTMEFMVTPLTTLQRVLAMTLASMPLWLLFAAMATIRGGLPSAGQLTKALGVAIFSGVTATVVFFEGTRLVRDHPQRLALVESTQCGELIFSFLGGIWLLGDPIPGIAGWIGLALIVGGMIVNSLLTIHNNKK